MSHAIGMHLKALQQLLLFSILCYTEKNFLENVMLNTIIAMLGGAIVGFSLARLMSLRAFSRSPKK